MTRKYQSVNRTSPGRKCKGCKRPFRRAGTSVKDFPGTLPHRKGGRCGSCVVALEKAEAARGTGQLGIKPYPDADPKHVQSLLDWVEDRRRRGVPSEGTMPHL